VAPDLDLYGMGVLSKLGNKLGPVWIAGKKILFLCFFCEIELIPLKFLRDSCKIPTFHTDPRMKMLVPN